MESLKPRLVFNPVIHHFMQCVHARALHPGAPLPPLDPVIERYLLDRRTVSQSFLGVKGFAIAGV